MKASTSDSLAPSVVSAPPSPAPLIGTGTARIKPAGLTDALRAAFSGTEIELHLDALCRATRMTPHGPVPDWSTRKVGLQLLLAYREGLPLPRKEEQPRHEITGAKVEERLRTRPGYRRAMRDYLDHLDQLDRS